MASASLVAAIESVACFVTTSDVTRTKKHRQGSAGTLTDLPPLREKLSHAGVRCRPPPVRLCGQNKGMRLDHVPPGFKGSA